MTTTAPALAHGLTDQEVAEFHERGYVIKRAMYARPLMERLALEVEGLHDREHRQPTAGAHLSWEEGLPAGHPPRIRQLMNSERVSPILDAMSRGEEMLTVMRQL